MIDIHIAEDIKSGRQVGIDEVTGGKKCNCICNSCGGELCAKKGKSNKHHFAHADKSKKDCDYSFWVSVRSLARQIIQESTLVTMKSNLTPFGFIRPINKKVSASWKNFTFDMLLETFNEKIYLNFITNENSYARNRDYTSASKKYFNEILLLEIDLRATASNQKHIASYVKRVIFEYQYLKFFFGAEKYYKKYIHKEVYEKKSFSGTSSYSNIITNYSHRQTNKKEQKIKPIANKQVKSSQKNICHININEEKILLWIKGIRKDFSPVKELERLSFKEDEITSEDINTTYAMISFFKNINQMNIELRGPEKIIATCEKLYCVRYKRELYFFSEIANNFIMYTVDEIDTLYLLKRIYDNSQRVNIISYINEYLNEIENSLG